MSELYAVQVLGNAIPDELPAKHLAQWLVGAGTLSAKLGMKNRSKLAPAQVIALAIALAKTDPKALAAVKKTDNPGLVWLKAHVLHRADPRKNAAPETHALVDLRVTEVHPDAAYPRNTNKSAYRNSPGYGLPAFFMRLLADSDADSPIRRVYGTAMDAAKWQPRGKPIWYAAELSRTTVPVAGHPGWKRKQVVNVSLMVEAPLVAGLTAGKRYESTAFPKSY